MVDILLWIQRNECWICIYDNYAVAFVIFWSCIKLLGFFGEMDYFYINIVIHDYVSQFSFDYR